MVALLKRYNFFLFSLICLVGLFSVRILLKPADSVPELIIYSYSSFSATWGPGPVLKQMFEEHCQCRLQMRDADDGRMLIQRLELEGQRLGADVIVGLNQWDLKEASDRLGMNRLSPEEIDLKFPKPVHPIQKGQFVPFDWGLLAFNTKKNSAVAGVKSLDEMLTQLPRKSLALQDPRTSAPGLNLLLWLVHLKGEDGAFRFLDKLKPKILTITTGWSASYGLFQKGEAKAVFSYVTSPIYHQVEEKNNDFLALSLPEGAPLHVELAGILPTCKSCQLASEFVDFLLSPEAQKVLMTKNYMLPVLTEVMADTPWVVAANYKRSPVASLSPEAKKRLMSRWTRWMRDR